MKLLSVSQLLYFSGLLLPSFATSSILTVGDDTVQVAVGTFRGAALRKLADYVKDHGSLKTEVTVVCNLESFHLGQVCSKISPIHTRSLEVSNNFESFQRELPAN